MAVIIAGSKLDVVQWIIVYMFTAITDPVDRRSSKKKVDKFFSVDVFLKLHDHHRDPACQFFDLFSILPSIFFHSQTFSAALDPALSNLGPLGFYVYFSI